METIIKQYRQIKKKHPDTVLLFRVGDFYETYFDDAVAASEILGITLTSIANGNNASIELAGFPHQALDNYLPKLVRAGRRVSICDKLEANKNNHKPSKCSYVWLIRDEYRHPISVCKGEVNARKQLLELARYTSYNRNWMIKNVNNTTIHFCNRDGSDNSEWIDMIELPLLNTVATFKITIGLLDEYDCEKVINNK